MAHVRLPCGLVVKALCLYSPGLGEITLRPDDGSNENVLGDENGDGRGRKEGFGSGEDSRAGLDAWAAALRDSRRRSEALVDEIGRITGFGAMRSYHHGGSALGGELARYGWLRFEEGGGELIPSAEQEARTGGGKPPKPHSPPKPHPQLPKWVWVTVSPGAQLLLLETPTATKPLRALSLAEWELSLAGERAFVLVCRRGGPLPSIAASGGGAGGQVVTLSAACAEEQAEWVKTILTLEVRPFRAAPQTGEMPALTLRSLTLPPMTASASSLGASVGEVMGLAVITSIQTGSPAHAAGLRGGEVIVTVNGHPCSSAAGAAKLLAAAAAARKPVTLILSSERMTAPPTHSFDESGESLQRLSGGGLAGRGSSGGAAAAAAADAALNQNLSIGCDAPARLSCAIARLRDLRSSCVHLADYARQWRVAESAHVTALSAIGPPPPPPAAATVSRLTSSRSTSVSSGIPSGGGGGGRALAMAVGGGGGANANALSPAATAAAFSLTPAAAAFAAGAAVGATAAVVAAAAVLSARDSGTPRSPRLGRQGGGGGGGGAFAGPPDSNSPPAPPLNSLSVLTLLEPVKPSREVFASRLDSLMELELEAHHERAAMLTEVEQRLRAEAARAALVVPRAEKKAREALAAADFERLSTATAAAWDSLESAQQATHQAKIALDLAPPELLTSDPARLSLLADGVIDARDSLARARRAYDAAAASVHDAACSLNSGEFSAGLRDLAEAAGLCELEVDAAYERLSTSRCPF